MASNPPRPVEIVPIEEEMQRSYLDYAMSVIVSRALPDVRDGLKPVHRRILYAMREGGYEHNRPPRKSALIVGDVMGKYHPHGGDAIYDALVRLAQDFSMRLPLIDGQGNFGSMDGDPPAAMRYTEVRLAQAADALLADIDKDTVDFRPNYDESAQEPVVLPARFPNLLVNGAGGIAVGMATNVPPHNLGEVIDACIALVDDPDLGLERLLELIPGPDFPTGGIILGQAGIRQAFATGRGSLLVRSRTHVEEVRKDRDAIIVTEVPYQVNKGRMLERIGELVRERRVEGIAEVRDESDRDGTRVVIELRREADPDIVLNQLFRHTPLQISFGVNLVALVGGRPLQLSLKDVLDAFLEFREEVIARRSAYDLARARERAHVLLGLALAVANIDAIIALIRAAPDPASARAELCTRDWPLGDVAPLLRLAEEAPEDAPPADPSSTYRLSERQAQAILDLRLHRLTQLERSKISDELNQLGDRIRELLHVLRARARLLEVLKEELVAVKERFATPRRTTIEAGEDYDIDIEDLIQKEDMVVTVTRLGYIKRTPLSTYRAQARGGKGRVGMATHEDDFLAQLFVANTHTPVLFFSSEGRVYKLKVYRLPLGTPQARGKAMVNLFSQLAAEESITAVLPLPEDESTYDDLSVVFATSSGKVRRNALADFIFVPVTGKIAMKLDEGDHLVGVEVATERQDVLLAARGGKCVRFPIGSVRVFRSRTSEGVRGMALAKGDRVISMSVLDHVELAIEERDMFLRYDSARRRQDGFEDNGEVSDEEVARRAEEAMQRAEATIRAARELLGANRLAELDAHQQVILSVTANGYGKRTSAYEYRVTNRGGQGIINIETSRRNGPVVAAFPVADDDQVMLVTDGGQVIRIPVDDIRIAGRNTQGVTLFDVAEDEHVVAVARLAGAAEPADAGPDEPDEPGVTESDGGPGPDGPDQA
ncbi:MAG TPA: DNA gyrase subunit A [Geminicoccaceae bacterium]|nr:DNA gyrase subunit A [Geminicoccaceae bacterium]